MLSNYPKELNWKSTYFMHVCTKLAWKCTIGYSIINTLDKFLTEKISNYILGLYLWRCGLLFPQIYLTWKGFLWCDVWQLITFIHDKVKDNFAFSICVYKMRIQGYAREKNYRTFFIAIYKKLFLQISWYFC